MGGQAVPPCRHFILLPPRGILTRVQHPCVNPWHSPPGYRLARWGDQSWHPRGWSTSGEGIDRTTGDSVIKERTMAEHKLSGNVNAVLWSHSGQLVAVAGYDGAVRL